jgi:hypothetical protein
MSIVSRLIAALLELERYEILEIERLIADIRQRRHRGRPIVGRFGQFRDHHGDIAMAFKLNTAYTAPLLFVQNGAPLAGPIGTVSASDTSAQISLSGDGQSVNLNLTAEVQGDITLTWSDPSGVVADFTVAVDTDNTGTGVITGSFGAFTEGTTV